MTVNYAVNPASLCPNQKWMPFSCDHWKLLAILAQNYLFLVPSLSCQSSGHPPLCASSSPLSGLPTSKHELRGDKRDWGNRYTSLNNLCLFLFVKREFTVMKNLFFSALLMLFYPRFCASPSLDIKLSFPFLHSTTYFFSFFTFLFRLVVKHPKTLTRR